MDKKLYELIVEMEEEEALELAKEYLEGGGDAQALLDVCRDAMDEVGNRFEKGEYFLSELLLGGEIFQSIMAIALPYLSEGDHQKIGKMVLGTVREDIHDIGKDIFKAFVEAAGFEVVDIGVDVPEEKFVEAVKEHQPDLVGMSCLITAGMVTMKSTIDAIREAGIETPIIIGGGRVDDDVQEYVGANAWADDAATGVRLSKELVGAN
ncbi:MAG: cobalamin-dependent protein [Bacillota bacterium]|jgi:methylmalonyl-CoA mutase cobalamin-binding domain/chain|nr:cobalamin-dependent protein [Bacillota bacterium]